MPDHAAVMAQFEDDTDDEDLEVLDLGSTDNHSGGRTDQGGSGGAAGEGAADKQPMDMHAHLMQGATTTVTCVQGDLSDSDLERDSDGNEGEEPEDTHGDFAHMEKPDQSMDGLLWLYKRPKLMQLALCCFTRRTLRIYAGTSEAAFVSNGIVCGGLNVPGQRQADYEEIKKLDITDDVINELYRVFSRIDQSQSGEVTVGEFHEFFRMRETTFSRRVFGMLDMNSSGEIDFKEFVVSIWNYCTFNRQSLALFAFTLFDTNDSGVLDSNELNQLIVSVYGDTAHSEARLQRIVAAFDDNGDGTVSKYEFVVFNNTQPLILFPAYQFQATLRGRILGTRWWTRLANEREKKFRGKNIYEILEDMQNDPARKLRAKFNDLSRPAHTDEVASHPLRKVSTMSSAAH